jgi:DNA-binding SARP family transcriptional activator
MAYGVTYGRALIRADLATRNVRVVRRLAEIAFQSGNLTGAHHYLRRLVELDELEEARWQELLLAMIEREDYKAASQTYNELRSYKPALTAQTKQLLQRIPARERRKKLQRDQIRRNLLQMPRHLPCPPTASVPRVR